MPSLSSSEAQPEPLSSEARYRAVVEDQTEIISRFLPDGTITFVNEVFCRLFGMPAAQVIGQRWHPVAHPDDVAMIEARLREMSPAQPVVTIENRVFVDRGEVRWMQFVNRGFFDAGGQLIETQCVGRDITTLKQAELALRKSEAALERAQAVARTGSFSLDGRSGRFSHTKETARLFDLDDRLEVDFAEWFSRVHPDDQPAVAAAWEAALHGAPYDKTYRIVVRGEVIWIRGVAELSFDDQGQLLECVGTVQDVTDHKRIETALRYSEERLALALAGSGLVLWDWNIADNQVTGDDRMQGMLGLSLQDLGLNADTWLSLIDPRDRKRFDNTLAAYLSGDLQEYFCEHRLRHKDGHWVSVEARGKVIERDEQGAPRRMVGTLLDITQRKQLNEQAVDLLRQIETLIRESTSRQDNPPLAPDALKGLTPRERQILALIAEGMTSSQIGEHLHLSVNTIVSHRKNLMSKLDLHTTVEVTRFAMDHGLLNPNR